MSEELKLDRNPLMEIKMICELTLDSFGSDSGFNVCCCARKEGSAMTQISRTANAIEDKIIGRETPFGIKAQ